MSEVNEAFVVVASDVGFTEGPVVMASGELAFTSIDRGQVFVSGPTGCAPFALTGGGPNGATEDGNGHLFIAQNGGVDPAHRWPGVTGGVQRVDSAGRVDWITQDPIYSNDLCFGPDGLLYVTDPSPRTARDDGRLWRVDAATGTAEVLLSTGWFPNGIGFGADDFLYVAQSAEGNILRFSLSSTGGLGRPELFAHLIHGRPDGFAFDVQGRLVVASISDSGPSDLQVYDSTGCLESVLEPGSGRKYTNVAIAPDKRLYVTDADGGRVLATDWLCAGLGLYPFR